MRTFKLLAAAAALAVPAVTLSAAPASAVALSGTINPFCAVVETSPTINLLDTSLQRVATLNVVCNRSVGPTIGLSAQNGVFKHNANSAFDIEYTAGYDLAGTVGNNGYQSSQVNLAGGFPAPVATRTLTASTELALGVSGVLNVDLANGAYVAGTYSETITVTLN